MQLVRGAMVLIAVLAVAGQYVQELKRVAKVKLLPANEAMRQYEAARKRGDRVLLAVSVLLAAAAGLTVVWGFWLADA